MYKPWRMPSFNVPYILPEDSHDQSRNTNITPHEFQIPVHSTAKWFFTRSNRFNHDRCSITSFEFLTWLLTQLSSVECKRRRNTLQTPQEYTNFEPVCGQPIHQCFLAFSRNTICTYYFVIIWDIYANLMHKKKNPSMKASNVGGIPW